MDSLSVHRSREAMEIIYDISQLLDTGLDKDTLSILVALVENGVNPEALATIVKEFRQGNTTGNRPNQLR
ncbi:hypothetical protein BSKO_09114 [Bryopsis sp. KO-2023]|nr:hypothetical protein BSKO_09114 [Bryopsis sp. KO-2023]